jgi:hypothetical protein
VADLAFADKRIQAMDIGNTTLPEDVREMYKRLNALSVGEGILPTLIKVSTLSGWVWDQNEMEDMILRLLESQPYDLRTINQTMCDQVWYLPIAISIETKTPDASEQEAKIQ